MSGRGFELPKVPTIGRGRGLVLTLRSDATRSRALQVQPTRPAEESSGFAATATARDREDRPLTMYKTRPPTAEANKEGTAGKEVSLSANYFQLKQKSGFEFCLYRVDFEPDIDHAGMRKAFVAQHKSKFGGYLFDGQSQLFLTRRLELDFSRFECVSREGQTYALLVKKTPQVIKMTDMTATHILNLILRRTMDGLKMQLVGRNLYDPLSKVSLNNFKVELWPGYITSVRQHEKNVLVCCEVSHKVMRQETIYEILRNLQRVEERTWKDTFKREIIGSTVLTDYNNNTYRIDDIDFDSSPKSTFKKKDEDVSYLDYYKEKYNIVIKDPLQPMLVSKPKARDIRAGRSQVLFLVPELCRATGLTEKMRSNFTMMKAMGEYTQMDPEKRKTRLLDFTRRLHESVESKAQLEAFNTDIDDDIIKFKGRALLQEKMLFGGQKTSQNNDNVDWTTPMKMNEMFSTVPLKRWIFIYPSKLSHESEHFLKLMVEVSSGMKYEMADPKKIELPDDRLGSYTQQIETCMQNDPRFIMIVVPNNAADRYAAIKKLTCVNRAIPTQVITGKTMTPKTKGQDGPVRSIATKVIVQINSKLGGAPWMINFPVKGMMSIGFDVTHDTKDRSMSYGAFVASMDLQQTVRYFSAVSAHKSGEEMSNNIEIHMMKALRAYQQEHGTLPERIFFYRDGVGEGQIEYIHKQEVARLEMKLNEIYSSGDKDPKFSFILVNKRLNTRIFLNQGSTLKNPSSGTIVDHTITLPERYDFYLISQSVRQGTVTPTSYNIIHDTNGYNPDKIQAITYKQTHLYYNWSGTTRVPAVVQYAHKLSILAGEFLHSSQCEGFNNQLYFL